jgi:CPSaseIIsmall: carbamoyl-phosphate synthase, small subunit
MNTATGMRWKVSVTGWNASRFPVSQALIRASWLRFFVNME